ncbi:acyltransferase [Staphylococcus hominis]|uniref:acyltransferase n=1 Tax=Staphylococcus hominis TaxID=1290 RepID=UPI0001EF50F2|nr:acyltransferase [Staphylococcus hominis]EFS19770.1 protein CapG [Staphylococcus hominis subsp. hominis C80]MCC3737063.1 acyltransferase [Staphylococcus hominis]
MLKKIKNLIFSKNINSKQISKLGVNYGENCRFLGVTKSTFGSEPYLIDIGNHVTITNGVKFITHDGGVWVLRNEHPTIDLFGKIKIGNNVFIGTNSIILPNVSIGNNVVIGAGSIVTKNIPDNCVYAGNPARFIKYTDDYKTKVLTLADNTKNMKKSEKKSYLLAKYVE